MRVPAIVPIVAVIAVGAAPLRAQQPAKPAPAPAQTPAQQPAKPGQPPAPGPPAAPAVADATPPDAYVYDPAGRRDPFVSVLGSGQETRVVSRHGEGPSGIAVADVSVRGVLQSKGALVAMVQGPDNKTYLIHPGDKLLDGLIKAVTPQGLVIMQEVNDPLSTAKQREVRKLLRSLEDAK